MKKDITGVSDIHLFVNSFYDKVKADPVIGYIFNDVAKVDWDTHLPVMYNFWEMVLFGTGAYKGDPMTKHIDLSKRTELNSTHFERWKELFTSTIDELFEGEKSIEAKERAKNIASLMLFRVQRASSNR